MSELERDRYDLFVGINTQTFAVICNSAVWAASLCVEMCVGQNLQERERKETRSRLKKIFLVPVFFSFFLFPRTGLSSLSYLSWE